MWGQSASSQGRDIYMDICDISPANNILTKVEYIDTIVFADTAFYHSVPIYDDNYAISVFDKQGNMKSAIDVVCIPNGYIDYFDVKFDNEENIYMSADFTHRVFLLDTAISIPPGPYDFLSCVFLLKIDNDQKIKWAQLVSSTHGIDLKSFTTDKQGNSVLEVATPWGGTVNFFNQDTLEYSNDMHGLVKVDKDGKILWRKEVYSDPTSFFIFDIINDLEGNTICYGRIMDDIIYDGETLNYGEPSIHGYKSFLLEIDTAGELKSYIFSATNISMFFLTNAPNNELYFSAPLYYYYDKHYMGKDTIIDDPDTAFSIVGRVDRFFNLKWYKKLKKRGSYSPIFAISATADSVFGATTSGSRLVFQDSIYEFGLYYGNLFVSFDKDGNVGMTNKIISEKDNRINDIKVDNCNDIVISSRFKGKVYLGKDTLSSFSNTYFDAYITKLNRDNKPSLYIGNDTSISIYDNLQLNVEEGYDNYLWSTGDTGNIINLSGDSLGLGNHKIWCTVFSQSCYISDTISISVYDDTGINTSNSTTLIITPNPTNSHIRISISPEVTITKYEVFNLYGQKIISESYNNRPIDVSNLSPGIYILLINAKEGYITRKFNKK